MMTTQIRKCVAVALVAAGTCVACAQSAVRALANVAEARADRFREKREQLAKDPDALEDILQDGAKRARAAAAPTMEKVRTAVGL